MDELLVEKEEIKGRIAGYRDQLETLVDKDDEHLRLQLQTARLELDIVCLKLEINGYEIQFNKAIAEGNEKDKHLYGDLISKRAANLQPLEERHLLAQQQQTSRGNF
jgi:hypothetical protein